MVFECTYAHSRYSWTSLKRLNRIVETRGVWPISPIRTLRLLCGRICEFCLNKDNTTTPYTSHSNTNPIPRMVRPGWPVFCCWPCLSESRTYQVSESIADWPGVQLRCITRPWGKVNYHAQHDRFYHKQFYLANRSILLEIFNHPRILAYPWGTRYFDIETDLPLSERSRNSFSSHDRCEIMWSAQLDKGGERIGALMSADLIQPLVEYLKTPNNLGIDHFLLDMIPNAPRLDDYDPFLNAFQAIRPKADLHEHHQAMLFRTKTELARYHKIENAIASLSLVEATITPAGIAAVDTDHGFELWNISVFRRIILCYQEEHNLSLRYPLTWDTGDFKLNRALASLFAPLMIAPTRVSTDELDTYATRFITICIKHLHRSTEWEANAVFDEHGLQRTTFGVNYRLLVNPRGWRVRRSPRSVTREWSGIYDKRRL